MHRIGDGLSRSGLADVLDPGDEIADLARAELVDSGGDRHAHADLLHLLGEPGLHVPNLGGAPEHALHDTDRAHDAPVLVVGRVEDQCSQRHVRIARRRGHPLHHGVEELLDPFPRLRRDPQDRLGGNAEDPLDLGRVLLGLGGRQVDLVEGGDDLEVVLEGLVTGGQGLGLDALRRVDEQHGPFAGGERPAHLVAEVHVAGGVDEMQDVVLEADPHVLGLDGDPPLPLEVHGVEVLLPHEAWVDGVGQLEDAVRQRRLPVVDMADDREIADEVRTEHDMASVPAQGSGSGLRGSRGRAPARLAASGGAWWAPPVRTGFLARPGAPPITSIVVGPPPSGARPGAAKNPMANIRSQIKRNRQNERRRLSNKSVRSEIRTRTKTAVTALDTGADDVARRPSCRRAAHRQSRRAGCDPQEPGGQPQVPSHAPGQRGGRGLSITTFVATRSRRDDASTLWSHPAG